MSKKLEGKIALITGGSRGIGAAIAKRLAADGANVAITYTKGADAAASVVKEIERAGRKAIAIQADATDAGAVEAAVEKTVASFGRLDVLVNNAGTAIPKRFEDTTLEELDRLIDVNVRGTLVATQAALKHMQNGGRIIMIGSSVGERVLVPGLVPYSATKGAVKMFTQGLSREVGSRGITVNNVQPGPIDTDLNPAAGEWAVPQKAATALDRYGRVDEVAALVAFVAGPESSYITGANLTVDGGMNARPQVESTMKRKRASRQCGSAGMLSLMHNGMVAPLFRHVDQRAITHQQYASSGRKVSNGKRGEETQHLF
jgi:3-oxoacyl-[acyl-carrier protein] reductase